MDDGRPAARQDGLFERGLKVRREVLGPEYVDRSILSATDFNRPLQELVTEYCWGAIWSRPGLDRRTRSLLNLAMLTAVNHQHELGIHVEGALRNGATRDEIREVLLQAAVYCGIPAAVDAFRTASAAIERFAATGTDGPAAAESDVDSTGDDQHSPEHD